VLFKPHFIGRFFTIIHIGKHFKYPDILWWWGHNFYALKDLLKLLRKVLKGKNKINTRTGKDDH